MPMVVRWPRHKKNSGAWHFQNLARALCLRPVDQWAMLAAYFDESGIHDWSKILTVSAVIAPVRQWERLITAWERARDDSKIELFHAADLWGGYNDFKHWKDDPEHRTKVYNKFVDIATRHVHWRAWSALTVQDYLSFLHKHAHKRARLLAYSICLTSCLTRIEVLANEKKIKIPIVCDQGGRGGPFALEMMKQLIRTKKDGYHRFISSISPGDKRLIVPLQVADLHAYEVFRYFNDQYQNEPVRPEFRKLLRIPQASGMGFLFDADNLRKAFTKILERSIDSTIGWRGMRLDRLDLTHSLRLQKHKAGV